MTVIHQDDFAFTPHPIDLLERTVENNGWSFERAGRDELNLSVAGKWSDHHFSFSWRDDLKSLHLTSTFDMRVTEDVRRQMQTVIDKEGSFITSGDLAAFICR